MKNKNSRSRHIILFIVLLLVIIGTCLLVVFGIGKTGTGSAKNIKLGLDLRGGVSITYEIQNEKFSQTDLDDTIHKLQLRVQNFSTESDVYAVGKDRITVDIPGETDTKTVLDNLGKPGSLEFVTYTGVEDDPSTEEDESIKIWLDGEDIKDAQPTTQKDQTTNATENVVQLTLTEDGSKKFEEATSANIGNPIYIIYDGEVISAPTVQTVISGNSAVITGMGSYDEASQLASTIRIGSLKLELQEVNSNVVSARLGDNALNSSILAGLIGLLLIMLFMIWVYRVPGIAAAIALIFHTALELLFLNAFDLTLTLPGIAGIILSVGMSVDANVIVYARMREEITAGKNIQTAIHDGFKKASSAIIDGNITIFVASLILIWKGSGTVVGFGQTLAIGIVLSVFTAMVISRIMANQLYYIGFKDIKFYGKHKARKTINFVKHKAIFFAIAIIFALSGLVTMGIYHAGGKNSLNYSVEFQGGTSTTVDFAKEYSIDEFNDEIKPVIADIIGDNDIQGQKVTGTNKLVIKTKDIDAAKRAEIKSTLIDQFGADENSFETVYISSSVSNEMLKDALIAVIIVVIFMLLYIWFRFKNIRFASSAVLALIHDILVVLAFYAIFRTSVGNSFIACMLTILGYCINSTIVIFDRIRENLKKPGLREDLANTVNVSITQTLTRSIYSSFTTFLCMAVLYIMGVEAIKEFAMPIMVGIVAGAFSSVLVTGPLYYAMGRKSKKEEVRTKS